VVRTRVGYCGGDQPNPTYYSIGDHTETLEIDFDPTQISYEQILDLFWKTHNPCASSHSRQYRSAIFYHDEGQKKIALATRDREAERRGSPITTAIEPLKVFYRAEDYHQKYMLRSNRALMRDFRNLDPKAFADSTAAARVNGYLGGHGWITQLDKEIDTFGLSPEGKDLLRSEVRGHR
jgi:peptide-methionine (S)-S-oxide reductase